MKFIVKIDSNEVLLSAAQVEKLTHILADCEKVVDHSVGKELGTHGYQMSYIHHIRPFNCASDMNLKVMDNERYLATKMVTKLSKEKSE